MALTQWDFLEMARRHRLGDEIARRHFQTYEENRARLQPLRDALQASGQKETPDHIAIKDYELLMLIEAAVQGKNDAREAAIHLLTPPQNDAAREVRDALIKGRPKQGFFARLFAG